MEVHVVASGLFEAVFPAALAQNASVHQVVTVRCRSVGTVSLTISLAPLSFPPRARQT
jgi:hypothetical protein